ncbi:MAG: DNA-3-methyladenine glycosylase [Bacteroidota bacterium]
MRTLPRSFYTRNTLIVAKELLGKILVRKIGKSQLAGIIVETEAYLHNDPASHSYRGITERTKVMFGNGGHLYVYFTYGMHHCANIVTQKEGRGEAVLLRAVEPIDGIDVMMKNRSGRNEINNDRHLSDTGHLKNLTNGPAKLAQSFGLSRNESGTDLLENKIYLTEGIAVPKSQIISTTRIGINVATEKKWRFYIKGNVCVSKP